MIGATGTFFTRDFVLSDYNFSEVTVVGERSILLSGGKREVIYDVRLHDGTIIGCREDEVTLAP